MRRIAVMITVMVVLSACSWDSSLYDAFVGEDGEVLWCSNDKGLLSYIELEEGVRCYQGNAQILASPTTKKCYSKWDCCGLDKEMSKIVWTAFIHSMCPMQAHNCINIEHSGYLDGLEDISDVSYCSFTDNVSCSFGYHLKGSKCVVDDGTSCGGKQCNIMGGWDRGDCKLVDGELRCIAEKCDDGYHRLNGLDDNQNFVSCEEDTVKHCGEDREPCQKTSGVDIVVCEQGGCLNVRCSNGYHWDSSGELCEEDDTTHCGSYNHDCTKLTGWMDGKCNRGVCEFYTCQDGYHSESDSITGVKTCVLDSNQACGKDASTCDANQQLICIQGECQDITNCAPPSKQCPGLGCVDVTSNIQACGDCEITCKIEHSLGVACQDSACVATACEKGYHIYDGKCEEDSINNCGQHDLVCKIDHASAVECSNIKCVATQCNVGYHVSNDKCVSDTNDCCGASCKNCMNTKCENGECSNNCVDDYADCNGESGDGCEIRLSDYGLVYENGACQCSDHYTQCGLYKTTSLPLCLDVKKGRESIRDDLCDKYCNDSSGLEVEDYKYKANVCEPKQTCKLQKKEEGKHEGPPPPSGGEGDDYKVVVCE